MGWAIVSSHPSPPSPLPFQGRGVLLRFCTAPKTQIPPLAPVKRGRGVGGEWATHPETAPTPRLLGKPAATVPGRAAWMPPNASRQPHSHPRTPVRGSPNQTLNTERRLLRFPSRLRGFAASRETYSPQSTRIAMEFMRSNHRAANSRATHLSHPRTPVRGSPDH